MKKYKKSAGLILSALLIISVATTFSSSAEQLLKTENGKNRYYFYMPEDWKNELSSDAGIYWWEGTDNCGTNWPGYKANKTDIEGLFYYDVPKDVPSIVWNNFIDGGTDPNTPIYSQAKQTRIISCEYYDPGENINYPDGTESFDNMIYVIDYDASYPYEWYVRGYEGQWYYYYGGGEYGFTEKKSEVVFSQRSFGTPHSATVPESKPVKPTFTVYFTDTLKWEQIYINHTNSAVGTGNLAPGDIMKFAKYNENGDAVYRYEVPIGTNIIVFSDGTEKSIDVTTNLNSGAVFELTEKLNGLWLYKTYMYTDKGYLLGDINLDGNINIKDATLIQKHLAMLVTIEGLGKPLADLSGDGKITIKDATEIQKHIANL